MPAASTQGIQTCGGSKCLRALADDEGRQEFTGLLQLAPLYSKLTCLYWGKPIPESFMERTQKTQDRLKRDWNPQKSVEISSLNTQVLLHHEHGGGSPGDKQIVIAWEVCDVLVCNWEPLSNVSNRYDAWLHLRVLTKDWAMLHVDGLWLSQWMVSAYFTCFWIYYMYSTSLRRETAACWATESILEAYSRKISIAQVRL